MRANIGFVNDPATRLLQLLSMLQRKPSWSGVVLAERLGVDRRTLRRDVGRLRSLGYEVESTPGLGGGYRLGGGKDVPPLIFDDEEATAVAVVLGVAAGVPVPGIEQGALTALAKLDRLLPPRLQAQLAALRAATVSLAGPGPAVASDTLTRLAQACEGHRLATFGYVSHHAEQTNRRVEPYRLVATDRRWYLVAFDLDRRDWRTFRVDRASSVTVTGHSFEPRPLVDPARLVAEAVAISTYSYKAVVRVRAPAEELSRLVPAHVGIVRPDGSDAVLELGADGPVWLAGYLVGLGFEFEVIAPQTLREHFARLGQWLQDAHVAPSPG